MCKIHQYNKKTNSYLAARSKKNSTDSTSIEPASTATKVVNDVKTKKTKKEKDEDKKKKSSSDKTNVKIFFYYLCAN